jgi:predicted NBD/HSP70 family sugar kinase
MALTGGLPGWGQPEALAELRAAFGPELTIENDVDAAALAELAHGHGRDADDFAFVHIGTGIGMGLVLGGRLHRGRHGAAGEIAFMPFGADAGPDGDPEEERRRGSLETAVAAAGVVRAARRAGMPDPITAQEVFAAGEKGDPRAQAVISRQARLVASAICCVVTVVDPALVILGGGIGQAPGLADSITGELAMIAPATPEVRVSALGTEAVVDGCLAEGISLAWDDLVAALP